MEKIDHLISIGEAILAAINELKEKDEIPMTQIGRASCRERVCEAV